MMTTKNTSKNLYSISNDFHRAAEAVGITNKYYEIGGYCIRLQFAGSSLAEKMAQALAHLEINSFSDVKPCLTICAFDSASTGISLENTPWKEYIPEGMQERWYFEDESMQVYFSSNSLEMLDRDNNIAFFWVPDERDLPEYMKSTPFVNIFSWWFLIHGYQLVHAAAVGKLSDGVLIIGKGGVGKSTTALSCLVAGYKYVGDDYCLISTKSPPLAYSLYNSAKLNHQDEKKFPNLMPAVKWTNSSVAEKTIYFLERHCPEKLVTNLPIKAILIPKITHCSDVTLKKVTASKMLLALAPSTLFQLPGAKKEAFLNIKELAEKIPVYILEVGSSLKKIPLAIDKLLSK